MMVIGTFLENAIATASLLLAMTCAHAAWPDRSLHLIVPYPPGGLTDALARAVGKALAERIGQPVIIDNIPGGGGNIGADKAAKSPADGYTIYIGNNATVGLNTLVYKKLAFDPLADLAPIMLIAESQTVLVVNPAVPARNIAELIALAKPKPGQLNFGSTGTGGTSHLAGEMFNSAAGEADAIKAAFWRYGVLIFPAQQLTADQHVGFAQLFGPLEPNINSYQEEIKQDRIDSRISDVSNLDHENEILKADSRKRLSGLANRLWHTDSIFRDVPARASLLYARSVAPIGGHTEFADTRAAWDALPEETQRRIDGLVVEHSIFHSRARLGFTDYSDRERAALPPAEQVLVRTLPETGRRALYIASHARRVLGLPDEEGTRLLEELMAHATQRRFVHTHRWRVHDLVLWDNRCTMHRGTDFDERRWKRDLQRATVSDIGNSCAVPA